MKNNLLICGLTAGCIYLLTSIAEMFPNFLSAVFCYPAAVLARLFTGGVLVTDNTGICCIKTNFILVKVTPECSGMMFFLLLLSVVVLACKDDFIAMLKILPLCTVSLYAFTLLLNSCRIISSYQAKLLLPAFPLPFETLHLAIGISIFLPALLLCYYGVNKFKNHLAEKIKL